MSDTKIIHASLDEIVEAVMPLYHRYRGENKCTLEKTSHELGDDEPMECSCDYTDRLRTALERFVVELPSDKMIEDNGKEGGLRDDELQMFWEGATWMRDYIFKTHATPTEKLPDANPHHCPQCSWQCSCSDQPCSCCTTPTEKGGEG